MDQKAELVTRTLVEAEFDVVFYLDQFGGLSGSMDPIEHFLQIGWIQGRDPSPQFSVFRYLRQNDDVLFRHLNPFVHYLTSGRDEGRATYPHSMDQSDYLPWEQEIVDVLPMWFDEGYYLSLNPELEGSPNLLSQFLVLGWAEGRDPCARFSVHKYFLEICGRLDERRQSADSLSPHRASGRPGNCGRRGKPEESTAAPQRSGMDGAGQA